MSLTRAVTSEGIINSCSDGRDGTLEVVVTGGSGSFSYAWEFSPATTTGTISSTIALSLSLIHI